MASAATATASGLGAIALGSTVAERVNPIGPLRASPDLSTGLPLLMLPPGFSYRSYSWTGQTMTDGLPTPALHDGIGAILADGRVRLVRNHEITVGSAFTDASYDPRCGGGATTLEFDPVGRDWLSCHGSLAGTFKNCAGRATPWGAWLSCEETTEGPASAPVDRSHGWVFEVPSTGLAHPQPLKALGRFKHEAVAFDPDTGIAYLTEDERQAGLYRFLPSEPGNLNSGRLQMLTIDTAMHLPTRIERTDQWMPVGWVDVDDPTASEMPVYQQGARRGGATFKRLEAYGSTAAVSTSPPPVAAGRALAVRQPAAAWPDTGDHRPLERARLTGGNTMFHQRVVTLPVLPPGTRGQLRQRHGTLPPARPCPRVCAGGHRARAGDRP